jgi:pimeloyl-ACP methyl ester carboxylesterase
MWPTQSFGLMQELASHGYLVASVAHPGESLAVQWADGEVTPMAGATLASMAGSADAWGLFATYLLLQDAGERRRLLPQLREAFDPGVGAMARRWAADGRAAVDHLLASPAADAAALAAHVDGARLAYAGMSLGGAAALVCCFDDPRARAAVNLDGAAWTFEHADRAVPVPALQLYADPEVNSAQLRARAQPGTPPPRPLTPATAMTNDLFYEPPALRGMRGDVVRAAMRGAGHMAFTDHALAARGPVRKLLGIGPADGRATQRRINAVVRAFLDRHLVGSPGDGLDRLLNDDACIVVQALLPETDPGPAITPAPPDPPAFGDRSPRHK